MLQTLAQLIDEGQLKVPATPTFPLNQDQQAQNTSQSGHGRGRIVLRLTTELTHHH